MALYYSEILRKHASATAGKGAGGGDALAGRSCDGEGRMTLAAKAYTCIGGGVLYEYGSLNRPCKASEIVDILGMHMSRVAVAMLRLDRKVDSLVNILDSHDRKYRHHQFVLNEGVIKIRLAYNTANLASHLNAYLFKNNSRVSAYAVAVYYLGYDTGLGILLINKNY